MQYRAEIDGLRALAVMPVIFFHAGLAGFDGGFVGVDVFFVISGYLITRLIVEEMQRGEFSILRFYERRARRILPALTVVVLATLPFAWMWMLPVPFKDYAQSLVAVAFFASNVLFWREADYFGPDALEKPMLHTWSLSVEEQFYVLFPLFLMLVWRFGRRPVFWMIAAGCAVSLGLAQLGSRYDAQANFYLPIGRAWELGLGALCAIAHVARGRVSNDALAWAGLAMIVGAFAFFDATTPTPSLWTLIPVGGAALIILFAGSDTGVGRLLALKPFVAIGLISYSAYLWHYPLFAFAHIKGVPVDVTTGLALTAVSLVLAWASWAFVEQPFRGRSPWLPKRGALFAASAATLASFVVIGIAGAKTDLRYTRYEPELANVLRDADDFRRTFGIYGLGTCFIDYSQGAETLFANDCLGGGERAVVLYGDSHAAHLSHGLREAVGEIAQYTGAECAPYTYDGQAPRCRDAHDRFMAWADAAPPQTVLLSADWLALFDRVGPVAFSASVTDTVTRLKAAGHEVALVRQTPGYRTHDWRQQLVAEGRVPDRLMSQPDAFAAVNRTLARLERRHGALGFDPAPLLCKPDGTTCDTVRDGRLLYTDRTHVTPHVSVEIGEAIWNAMRGSAALTLLNARTEPRG